MKKGGITFLIISVLFVGTTIAQPAAGGLFVGGSFNFSTGSEKGKSATTTVELSSDLSFGIAPKVGFFMSDNMAVGASIGFSTYRNEVAAANRVTNINDFEITPFARYYMGSGNFGLFGEGIISLGFGGSSTTIGNITTEGPPTNSLRIGAIPGVYYFISENFALEAQFGFFGLDRSVVKTGTGDTEVRNIDSQFLFNFNPGTITFGLMYRL